jgi:hypothetical protein
MNQIINRINYDVWALSFDNHGYNELSLSYSLRSVLINKKLDWLYHHSPSASFGKPEWENNICSFLFCLLLLLPFHQIYINQCKNQRNRKLQIVSPFHFTIYIYLVIVVKKRNKLQCTMIRKKKWKQKNIYHELPIDEKSR